MRVLVAFDGSRESGHALALAASLGWPSGSRIRVITVAEEPDSNVPTAAVADGDDERARDERVVLADALTLLGKAGLDVDGHVLIGRPASAIVADADDFDADVILCGARGHGGVEGVMVGSVSLELVDHAHRAVLVARRPVVSRILFATDGSPAALAAEHVLATWPVFATTAVDVVSVAHIAVPLFSGVAPTMVGEVLEACGKDLEAASLACRDALDTASSHLARAGRAVSTFMPIGDPVDQILTVAREQDADLLVVGSRGQAGLTRLLSGSVARGVLHHATASVLVIHAAAVVDEVTPPAARAHAA
jgi:nucleotide-binding universal stress UspA family protein